MPKKENMTPVTLELSTDCLLLLEYSARINDRSLDAEIRERLKASLKADTANRRRWLNLTELIQVRYRQSKT